MSENGINTVDTAAAFDEFRRNFEAFRETNDDRLAEIERRSADVLSEEKLARIDKALDDSKARLDAALIKARRPALGGDTANAEPWRREHKAAFESYVRGGDSEGLKRLEANALSAGSGPDGGYLVPVPAEVEILRRMAQASPIRAIASVRAIANASFKKAFSKSGPQAAWVAETTARAMSDTQQLADLSFPTFELSATPAATQTLLDDAVVDVEQWIADEVATAFAEQEGTAFVNGDGSGKPKGFMAETTVANGSWTWGKLGYVATGEDGALPDTDPSDVLIDLVYALKAGYRQNARFVMSRATQGAIRKLKTTTGEYLWQPPAVAGGEASLMNFPVVEAEDMPGIASGACAMAFGDFQRGYLIVDRTGIRVLRDPYTSKPYVLFYTTKRVGGGVQDYDAIKLLKFAAS
jgi:HK97 family phage major capsid protein